MTDVKIKMINYFDSHWYRVELTKGEVRYVPSVTQKLGIIDKPFLSRWRGDLGNREADMRVFEAQRRGSRIHQGWETFCKGGTIIFNPQEHPNYTEEEITKLKQENALFYTFFYQDEYLDLLKLAKFMEIVQPKILATEQTVVSLANNDAGTLDNLFEIKEGSYLINGAKPLKIPGGIYVADLKTGSQVDKSAYRQTAAYVQCVQEMGIANPVGTMILHTQSKNRGGIEGLGVHLRAGNDLHRDYDHYRMIAALWDVEHEGDAPRDFEYPTLVKLGGLK
jgi:hypothetical protein